MWFKLIYIVHIWDSWGPIRPFLSTHFFRLNNPDSQSDITCLVLQHPNHFFGPPPGLLQYTNIFLLLCVQLYVYLYMYVCICVCVYLETNWICLTILLQVIVLLLLSDTQKLHIKFCWWTTAYYSNVSRWLGAINSTWFNELSCINRATKLPPLSTENAKQVIMRIWLPISVKKLSYCWTEEMRISLSEWSNLYEIDFIFYFMRYNLYMWNF